jgi:hypothetical protein
VNISYYGAMAGRTGAKATARAERRIRGASEAIAARVRSAARASGEGPRVRVVIGRGLGYDMHFICDVGHVS